MSLHKDDIQEQKEIMALFSTEKILSLGVQLQTQSWVVVPHSHFTFIRTDKPTEYCLIDSNLIGQGSFGTVSKGWLVRPNLSDLSKIKFEFTPCAVKNMSIFDEKSEDDVKQEEKALRALADPEVKRVKIEKATLLIMKYLPGEQVVNDAGVLHPAIAKLALTQRIDFTLEILTKLKEIHDLGWVHGDPKGQNIKFVLDKEGKATVFLTDFALARNLEGQSEIIEPSSPGSIGHLAPERVEKHTLSTKVDIFAIASDIIFILAGGSVDPLEAKLKAREKFKGSALTSHIDIIESKTLYNFKGLENILDALKVSSPISTPAKKILTAPVIELLKKMTEADSEERPELGEVIAFFKDFGQFCDSYQREHAKKGLFTTRTSHDAQIIKGFIETHHDKAYGRKLSIT